MECCSHCVATEEEFGPKSAKKSLKHYRKKGPDKSTGQLLKRIRDLNLDQVSLLDIGGGVGIIHHELLKDGFDSAVQIDASSASIAMAKEEDSRQNNSEKVEYLHGDAVDLAGQVSKADVVTLDHVVCCYPEWNNLIQVATEKAERYFVMSAPIDRWYSRWIVSIGNFYLKLKRTDFRTFVHPSDEIHAKIIGQGFQRRSLDRRGIWEISLYAREVA